MFVNCGTTIGFTVILNLINLSSINGEDPTLQQVHIFFRHGDRTTDASTVYPKDPYINETYWPYGAGELTKKGKQRAFKLGEQLRQRYADFLGTIYTPDILSAMSSPYSRCITSLELVLAGLFPPSKDEIFQEGLLWQPIPFYHMPKAQDRLFLAIDNCPNYQERLNNYKKSKEILQEMAPFRNTFDYISNSSGRKIEDYFDLLMLNSALTTEKEWGLELPEWTKKLYPHLFKAFAVKSFRLLTGTAKLRQAMAGYFLQKVINGANAKINNTLQSRKLFLYSGHEFNIGSILSALDIFEDHLPPYSSHILIELHKIDHIYGINIYYQNYKTDNPKLLKLPACQEFCPLTNFVSLMKAYMPDEDTCGN